MRLLEVTEVVDLVPAGRKNVRAHWFVIWRKRPLFGPNGSVQPDYRGVIAEGAHDQDCEFAAEEFFTADEAEAFAEFTRTRLHAHVKIEPAKLPISNDRKSFAALFAEFVGDLAVEMLALDDGAGNELDFAVGCYDESPLVEGVDKLLAEFEAAGFIRKIHNGNKPTYTVTTKGMATKDWMQAVAERLT